MEQEETKKQKIACFRPLSGSYISQLGFLIHLASVVCFRPLSGSYISQFYGVNVKKSDIVSVPYRGATFLNKILKVTEKHGRQRFRPLSGSYISQSYRRSNMKKFEIGFRPLSGSYISQYHPRNPMSCLGQIGGLRGKSNFIEMQPFWKVKNSHKSNI